MKRGIQRRLLGASWPNAQSVLVRTRHRAAHRTLCRWFMADRITLLEICLVIILNRSFLVYLAIGALMSICLTTAAIRQ
ncbi:hypothetical protein AMJ85_09800 [candidate division BRC1 bacterium SM23_51]|nr:MAG: hypothetical protein AMJ85_09800 [candidate division BRC1 bacterium SM23_51]